jgi:cleavage and polyadenylation specificity factor subunit 6/7
MDPDDDPMFHRSETISAVQDVDQYYDKGDGFSGLNNDVNVGDLPISHHLNRSRVTSRP